MRTASVSKTAGIGNAPARLAYLPAGISHWKLGRFDMYRVNPPLIRLLASVPVILAEPKPEWEYYQVSAYTREARWEFGVGGDFLAANGLRSFWYFTVARRACIPSSLLGGYICSRWSHELYGPPAGILALIDYVVPPPSPDAESNDRSSPTRNSVRYPAGTPSA